MPIPGTTKTYRSKENLGAAKVELSIQDIHEIDELEKLDDVQFTLFLRNKNRLGNRNLNDASIVEGDVMNYSTLKDAIAWQDYSYPQSLPRSPS